MAHTAETASRPPLDGIGPLPELPCAVRFSVVVPVYNNADGLEALLGALTAALEALSAEDGHPGSYEIVCVDDGSRDASWLMLRALRARYPQLRGLRLMNNFGQMAAIACGLEHSRGTYIATIDDDLQYDPQDLLRLYRALRQQNRLIVYGIRAAEYGRVGGWRRRRAEWINYLLTKQPSSNFRMMNAVVLPPDRKLQLHFEAYDKRVVHPNLRGYIPVPDLPRAQGHSGYNWRRKLALLLHLYTEQHNLPMRNLVYIGGLMALLSLLALPLLALLPGGWVRGLSAPAFWVGTGLQLGLLLALVGLLTSYVGSVSLIQKGSPFYRVLETF